MLLFCLFSFIKCMNGKSIDVLTYILCWLLAACTTVKYFTIHMFISFHFMENNDALQKAAPATCSPARTHTWKRQDKNKILMWQWQRRTLNVLSKTINLFIWSEMLKCEVSSIWRNDMTLWRARCLLCKLCEANCERKKKLQQLKKRCQRRRPPLPNSSKQQNECKGNICLMFVHVSALNDSMLFMCRLYMLVGGGGGDGQRIFVPHSIRK